MAFGFRNNQKNLLQIDNTVLVVERAPEPDDIKWENVGLQYKR
jgi:hypothetical protein